MLRVLKMMHNAARDKGNMVSIYRHSDINDCLAQFDMDRANRHKQHTQIDEDEVHQWKPTLFTVFKPTQELLDAAGRVLRT